jgi:histone H3/H4
VHLALRVLLTGELAQQTVAFTRSADESVFPIAMVRSVFLRSIPRWVRIPDQKCMVYTATAVEYLVHEMLDMAVARTTVMSRPCITMRDIIYGIENDREMRDAFAMMKIHFLGGGSPLRIPRHMVEQMMREIMEKVPQGRNPVKVSSCTTAVLHMVVEEDVRNVVQLAKEVSMDAGRRKLEGGDLVFAAKCAER